MVLNRNLRSSCIEQLEAETHFLIVSKYCWLIYVWKNFINLFSAYQRDIWDVVNKMKYKILC